MGITGCRVTKTKRAATAPVRCHMADSMPNTLALEGDFSSSRGQLSLQCGTHCGT